MKFDFKIILIILAIGALGFFNFVLFKERSFEFNLDFLQKQKADVSGVNIPVFEKPISEMNVPELQTKISQIINAIAQLQALLNELNAESIQQIPSSFTFNKNLIYGQKVIDVKYLQMFLNSYPDTRVAETGFGSLGYETMFFGFKTKQAILRFQQKYYREISLIPKYKGVGFVEYQTRAKINSILGDYRALAVVPTPTPTPTPTLTPTPTPVPEPQPTPIAVCGNNDAVCPLNCRYPQDLDCAYCGDNTIQKPNNDNTNEICDGLDLDGKTCINMGYDSGELVCSGGCLRFDTSNCSAVNPPQIVCGNGNCDGNETCSTCSSDCGQCPGIVKPVISPDSIIPKPQNINMLSSFAIEMDSSWKIVASLNNQDESFTANYLKNKINNVSSLNIEVSDISNIPQNKRIVIGNPNENSAIAQIASSKGININSELQKGFDQGYILLIEPEQILILGKSTTGTFYGAVSLTWLLKKDGASLVLPNTKITDWPDLKIRAFLGSKEPNHTKESWTDELVKYKYNMWSHVITPLYSTTSSTVINSALQMKEYLIKRHFYSVVAMEPTEIAKIFDPNLYEGIYAYNISMKFNETDYAVSLEQNDVQLTNAGFENDSNSDNMPDYWRPRYSNRYGNWFYDCSASHSGNCSIKLRVIKNLEEAESSPYLYSSDIFSQEFSYYNLKPDRTYTLSFWAKKAESSSNGKSPIVVVTMKNPVSKEEYNLVRPVDINNQWQKYSLRFSTANNFTQMQIFSQSQATNTLELWLDDFEVIDITDKLYNVIRTSDTRLHVWNKDRTIEYTEGSDYQLVESGQININNPEQGKLTKIKRISTGSIPVNAEIKADYDFVVNFIGGIWNSFSDPYFLQLYENNLVRPSMTKLNPDFVFINIDEIADINRDSRSKKRGLENYQLLANFINNITRIIKSYNPNVRVMTWDDMQNPLHNGGDKNYPARHGSPAQKTWPALGLLDKSLIQISWWYYDKDYLNKMALSPLLFQKYGFEFLAGPANYANGAVKNIKWWSYLAYKYNGLGMMLHSFYNNWSNIDTAGNYSWNAVKEQVGCSPDYIEICDGIDNDCNNIYYGKFIETSTGFSNIDEGLDSNDDFKCGN